MTLFREAARIARWFRLFAQLPEFSFMGIAKDVDGHILVVPKAIIRFTRVRKT